jgi:tRNA-splicing ligase RtcB
MAIELKEVSGQRCHWIMPRRNGMKVDGIVFGTRDIIRDLEGTKALEQVRNVAYLPGILQASMAMPDIHEGYGFPIGGVAATDLDNGVISPGGIGYDINCGVRLMVSNLSRGDAEKHMEKLVETLFSRIPSGVGREGTIRLSKRELEDVLTQGAKWAVSKGYGWNGDLKHSEEQGAMDGADPGNVSERAFKRGQGGLGTLGSGNHFIEVSFVEQIFDEKLAEAYGLFPDQVVFWVHSGSRGLGHQVCTDYLQVMRRAVSKYGISLPDRQLDCAPTMSDEGKHYFSAMASAANYAWANRQVLAHYVRESAGKVFGKSPESLGMHLLYDVAHNIGKLEVHDVGGTTKKVLVHRKGATRAFGPGHKDVPERYRHVGQPVLIPGDMGTGSYILSGTERAMALSFGSACHGAGRALSRTQARRAITVKDLKDQLASYGVYVQSATTKGLVEEAPGAYKDVGAVVEATAQAGLARKVARVRPMGVIKG